VSNLFWRLVARIVSRPAVAAWLIERAQRTPYTHIMSLDGQDCYMGRWWLFNPYPSSGAPKRRGWGWLPSVRIHYIMREDRDRHFHDHPWDARTIILHGWYVEYRGVDSVLRVRGDTATLKFGEYHRIATVPEEGVWTLFITWKYRGTWGFVVDGKKVPWRQYVGLSE